MVDITCNSLNDGNLDNLPPLSNGEWDCANVRGSIEVLYDILLDAVTGGTLAELPVLNTGDFTINVGTSPLVDWNVSNAVYDYASGNLALTIGNHSLNQYQTEGRVTHLYMY